MEKVEAVTEADQSNTSKPFEDFKKPVFIGKVGKLPKKFVSGNSTITKASASQDDEKKSAEELPKASSSNEKPDAPIEDKKKAPGSQPEKNILPLPYKEPKWSGLPPEGSDYSFEVLKSGTIVETIDLNKKPYYVFGRLSGNDVIMANPTISRYHAVVQYKSFETEDQRPCGFYLYDLGSSFGSFINKTKVKANHYVRVKVGHLIKLGCSTRQFILQGPEEEQEPESELSLTEMKELRRRCKQQEEEARLLDKLKTQQEREEEQAKQREEGVTWGMADDAEEETDLSENPYARSANEDLYLDDPKKTLRGYFEREGVPLQYSCDEKSNGQFVCRVELPVEDARGNPVRAEVVHKGKKKDAVVQCALEACRILDRQGLLRQAKHESRKRKSKDWKEDDYYDSDDDTFLDRTGAVESKREDRMRRERAAEAAQGQHQPLTYQGLCEESRAIEKKIQECELKLEKLRAANQAESKARGDAAEEGDALDQFMSCLSRQATTNKADISKTKFELQKLKGELAKTQRLAEIAKPADLPALVPPDNDQDNAQMKPLVKKTATHVIIGKRIKIKNREKTPYKPALPDRSTAGDVDEQFVEENDSDEEDVKRVDDRNVMDVGECKEKKVDVINEMDVGDCREKKVDVINEMDVGDCKEKTVDVKKDVGVVVKTDEGGDRKSKGKKKVFGPMRPPTNYVIPEDYYNQESDRDKGDIMDEE